MKGMKIVIIIVAAVLVLAVAGCGMILKNSGDAPVEVGGLKTVRYSPGYGDSNGGHHSTVLKRNDAGDWIIECTERVDFESPEIVTTYAVSAEDEQEFEAFIKERNVLALKDRKESDDFVTDYSPWGYSFNYDNSALGGGSYELYSFGEYQVYSNKDYELIKELKERLEGLKGEKISEVEEQY